MRPRDHAIQYCCLFIGLFMAGCSASYIKASVPDNPLDRVAQQAKEEWSLERVNANMLEISDAWPIYSIGALGYGASHATLHYDPADSELNVQYYFKAYPLMTLWIPISIDAESGLFGAALKPTMRDQINRLIGWSGGTITSRRAGDRSEPFPPPVTKATAAAPAGR